MSARGLVRIRVGETGSVEIVDPSLDDLDLLSEIDPAFAVRSEPLPGFSQPRFLTQRVLGTGVAAGHLQELRTDDLWRAHAASDRGPAAPGEATRLELKIELARRILSSCTLCAHRCRVDRHHGASGVCRLGAEAIVANHFVHIAEEPPINPSYVLNLAGCGLRCRYCQQWALLDPAEVVGVPLDSTLWREMDLSAARSLSFVGGNPDESLYAILQFLKAAPATFELPVVWNSHGYSTPEVITLLDGVVDAYVPDWKYGSDDCARRWSAAPEYTTAILDSVAAMAQQSVPVFVRLLVLPGHVECCHLPALQKIALLGRPNIRLSIRAQYYPDWHIDRRDGVLCGRPTTAEVALVRRAAASLGLAT
jgi:putative pyruvate formate lyase activating enzyme